VKRPPIYNAFVMNCVTHITSGTWKSSRSRSMQYMDLDLWTDLAKLLEKGKFDAMFLADVIGVYDVHRRSSSPAIREAMQVPSNDPAAIVSAMAAVTEHLGFAFTSSVIQEHPFEFARKMSTLDHLTKGRIAWNIVTSYLNNAAENFGQERLSSHEERYAWAEEYLDVTCKLWEGSWEDDAVLRDTENGVYADPDKIHRIDHVGERYRVAGPHLCEPSPQRTPVLYQAGASSSGRAFAARHAEAVFLVSPHRSVLSDVARDVRAQAVAAGRRAEDIAFVQALTPVVGSTEAEVKRKLEELEELETLEGVLVHLGGNVGIDLSAIDPERPVSDLRPEEMAAPGIKAFVEAASSQSQTFGELATLMSHQIRRPGTPEQLAEEFQGWVDAGANGFNIFYTMMPGSFEDFVEQVAPLLQERGLMQREYTPGTLREKLGGDGPYLPESHPARRHREELGDRDVVAAA
jgi:FMN-dependent oxidoreductase (nitrilotriacetate monooxygenase family)